MISDSDVESYKKDGAIFIKGLLNSSEISILRKGIDLNISCPSSLSKIASCENDPGEFFEDFCTWKENEFYQKIIFNSQIPEIASKLMISKQVRLYHDHMLVKKSGTQQRTPWHQALPYYNIEGSQNISFWIPVDPVPIESSLNLVAGSHKGRWYLPRTFLKKQANWFPEGSLEEPPDISKNLRKYKILSWRTEPGDAVAFHMLTLHSGSGSKNLRRVFSVRLLGDDIRHAPRNWETSPEFPGLSKELPAGFPLENNLFPIIWPKKFK